MPSAPRCKAAILTLLLPLWCGLSQAQTETQALPSEPTAACTAQLSAAQRARFQLATGGCASQPVPRTTMPGEHADALVASAGVSAAPRGVPAQESAHLQLFSRSGVVMARLGPADRLAVPARQRSGGSTTVARRAVGLAPEIDAVARRHDVDPLLLHAIAHVESRHDPQALSHAGARGLMQVMPATGERFGVNNAQALHHTGTNLAVSAAYLKTLQKRFDNNLTLVLAAYNAGEGAVERYGRRVPRYAETQDYVKRVLALYGSLTATAGAAVPVSFPVSPHLSRPD